MIGAAVSAGANLVGGYLNRRATEKANASNLAAQQAHTDRQIQLQKKFAQEGIRWRVEDAKKAGIHPLYALGASVPSYTPSAGAFNQAPESMGSAFAAAGQDIGRAINATRTAPERQSAYLETVQGLQVKNLELDTEIKKTELASRLQRLRANTNPPIPTGQPFSVSEGDKAEARPPLMMGGDRWATNPNTSNMEDFEKRAGDEGPYNWLATLGVLWNDIKANYGEPASWPTKMVHEAASQLAADARREYGNAQRFVKLPNFGRRW